MRVNNRRLFSLLVLGAFLTIVYCANNAIAGKSQGHGLTHEQMMQQEMANRARQNQQSSQQNPNSP